MESEMKFCVNNKCVTNFEIKSLNKQLNAAICASKENGSTFKETVELQQPRMSVSVPSNEFGVDDRPDQLLNNN